MDRKKILEALYNLKMMGHGEKTVQELIEELDDPVMLKEIETLKENLSLQEILKMSCRFENNKLISVELMPRNHEEVTP